MKRSRPGLAKAVAELRREVRSLARKIKRMSGESVEVIGFRIESNQDWSDEEPPEPAYPVED